MSLSHNGAVHKIFAGIILSFCLVLALIWPKYKKHQMFVQARTALERGKEIAFVLDKYKNKYRRFTPDFAQIELSFDCARNAENTQLTCDNYTYRLDNGPVLHIRHTTLAQWFDIDVANGTVSCDYAKDFPAGAQLCEHAYVPIAL